MTGPEINIAKFIVPVTTLKQPTSKPARSIKLPRITQRNILLCETEVIEVVNIVAIVDIVFFSLDHVINFTPKIDGQWSDKIIMLQFIEGHNRPYSKYDCYTIFDVQDPYTLQMAMWKILKNLPRIQMYIFMDFIHHALINSSNVRNIMGKIGWKLRNLVILDYMKCNKLSLIGVRCSADFWTEGIQYLSYFTEFRSIDLLQDHHLVELCAENKISERVYGRLIVKRYASRFEAIDKLIEYGVPFRIDVDINISDLNVRHIIRACMKILAINSTSNRNMSYAFCKIMSICPLSVKNFLKEHTPKSFVSDMFRDVPVEIIAEYGFHKQLLQRIVNRSRSKLDDYDKILPKWIQFYRRYRGVLDWGKFKMVMNYKTSVADAHEILNIFIYDKSVSTMSLKGMMVDDSFIPAEKRKWYIDEIYYRGGETAMRPARKYIDLLPFEGFKDIMIELFDRDH